MSKYSFPPQIKFFIGTSNPDGTFGPTVSPRVNKEEFEEVVLDFLEYSTTKDQHAYYVLPQNFIDDFAKTIRNNFRADLESLYLKLKSDDIDNVMRRFETRATAIIQGRYGDDAEAFMTDCNNVVRYQKEKFLSTQNTLNKNPEYRQPFYSPNFISNINDMYAIFVVMRNLYGISLLVDANTKHFKENLVLTNDFNEIEDYLLKLLNGESRRLEHALCWSLLHDLKLVHQFENARGEKLSDEDRKRIINANIYIPNVQGIDGVKPWYDSESNYQKKNINLTDTWVTHYLQILQMLKEIRYLKFVHQALLTRYEAQFDTDAVQDPELEQTLYLAKDIFTSATQF